jgi:NAD+ kinase
LRIGVVARSDLPEAIALARRIMGALSSAEIILEEGLAEKLGMKGSPVHDMDVDAIVTIGGDGTVLSTLRQAPAAPVLGINMGGIGFLADVDPSDAEKAVREMVSGKLKISERRRLAIEVSGERFPDALNEAVVCAANTGKTITFKIVIDGMLAAEARGDGVIVSTPTGATAYSLAAGGPVIDPRLRVFSIVPVCTCRPWAPPMVVPDSCRVEVVLTRPDRRALLVIDGWTSREVSQEDRLTFYSSKEPARFFVWAEDFYSKLRRAQKFDMR